MLHTLITRKAFPCAFTGEVASRKGVEGVERLVVVALDALGLESGAVLPPGFPREKRAEVMQIVASPAKRLVL